GLHDRERKRERWTEESCSWGINNAISRLQCLYPALYFKVVRLDFLPSISSSSLHIVPRLVSSGSWALLSVFFGLFLSRFVFILDPNLVRIFIHYGLGYPNQPYLDHPDW